MSLVIWIFTVINGPQITVKFILNYACVSTKRVLKISTFLGDFLTIYLLSADSIRVIQHQKYIFVKVFARPIDHNLFSGSADRIETVTNIFDRNFQNVMNGEVPIISETRSNYGKMTQNIK